MADLEAVETRLSFDDILEAVQDSRRGRWFLQEYEARLQKRDTHSIMQAISRLESRMETMGSQGQSSPDDLVRVRTAINNARNDLLKLGLGKEAMSKEGKLFAEIADLARKSMPQAVDSNAGIVRTLQLVEEIDTVISAPADRGAQYFAADAALFETPVAATKPAAVVETKPAAVAQARPAPANDVAKPAAPVAAEKKEDTPPVGARLVIRKASETPDPAPVAQAEPAAAAPAPAPEVTPEPPVEIPVVAAAEPVSELPRIDNPRIVIIRRKAEEMPEVDVSPRNDAETAA